jgi:hypothetical protein
MQSFPRDAIPPGSSVLEPEGGYAWFSCFGTAGTNSLVKLPLRILHSAVAVMRGRIEKVH